MPRPLHIAILSLAVLTAGCANARPSAKSSAGPGDIVRLVSREAGSAPNDHPANFTSTQLHQMLSLVRASGPADTGDGSDTPSDDAAPAASLFQGKDLDALARQLALALSRSMPDQDVAFRVAQLRADDRLELLKASRITAARVFRRDDKLHLIFGRIDADPREGIRSHSAAAPRTALANLQDPALQLPDEIGSRRQPLSRHLRIAQSEGIAFPEAGRPEWIALSLTSKEAVSGHSAGGSPEATRRITTSPEAATTEQRKAATELESRLTELRKLRDAGLITDEVYRATMQRLLDAYL